jgi:hypothetical protein
MKPLLGKVCRADDTAVRVRAFGAMRLSKLDFRDLIFS